MSKYPLATIKISDNLSVEDFGTSVYIVEKGLEDAITVNYGKELDDLIFCLLTLQNSKEYGLPTDKSDFTTVGIGNNDA